jgi:hypothetical protein
VTVQADGTVLAGRTSEEVRNMTTSTTTDGGAPAAPSVTLRLAGLRGRSRPGLRTVVGRYLLAGVVLLGLVLVVDPHDPERAPAPTSTPWQYQRETLTLEGGGVLNGYARAAVSTTAWLTKGSIERARDVNRLNLLDFLVGEPAARRLGGWRADNGVAIEWITRLAVLVLAVYGMLMRPSGRGWVLAILMVLSAVLLLTKPQTTVRLASAASTGVPRLTTTVFANLDPSEPPKLSRSADDAQRELAADYWRSFVANPLSRVQTGTAVLAGAEPERKGGVLDSLRRNVGSVNAWAIGDRGVERAFIATTALLYVLPFALLTASLSMVASSAQAVLFVLCLAGLVTIPLAVDRRRRPAVFCYWALPLAASAAVLAAATLVSLVVMRTGAALHAADEYVGALLAGSTWPVIAVIALRKRMRRRRAASTAAGSTAESERIPA